jgi:CHRD domain
MPEKGETVAEKPVFAPLILAAFWLVSGGPVFAAEGYQTNMGPTPLDNANRVNVLGRGAALATLDGTRFMIRGSFAGLATPATDAHLCMGNVMGGTGPVITDVTVTPAVNGEISGTVTLTPEQVAGLKAGRIYLLIDSQKAPKGNLWGWFQPAHKTVGQDVPEHGHWYIPNILQDTRKNPQS